ncbi:unnamed protein product [Brassicogethes aeneus]|uniref:BTB domain-containing protein n=1 Tax=Brassicogethes aeneus TaxID=1431903 RepID=A0A9P0AR88_BRAAE|nr:unnamed protein product [Brassicogethes aeneus]
MTMQQYCLRWNNHQPNFISVFSSLLNSESLVDVTLAAEGKHLQAHKVVLSACSSYFQQLFTINPCQHPIVILKDVKFIDLKVMVDFMYYGEVNVSQDQLPCILKTAEMLKIKGLAEIPVDQSIKQSSVNDKAELLTPGDSNWSSSEGVQRKSLSPSPCPLSPTARRKRLRKLSNGSNSGSGERTSEDQPTEILLSTSTGSLLGTVIKTEQRSMESSPPKLKQHSSTESDLVRGSSFESTEGETHHSITLQVPQQQDINTTQSIETTSLEVPGPSTSVSQQSMSEKPISKTHPQYSQFFRQSPHYHHPTQHIGTKRGRFLMRQPAIKRETDSSQAADGDPLAHHRLSVPTPRVERQCSEPLPVSSPPPGNLLAVPGAVLVKQHSHPLLPSQTHPPLSPPLRIHLMPHTQISEAAAAERAISPVVVVSDHMNTTHEMALRADSAPVAPASALLRVRTEELRRSASSPQSSTRSSHCPVVRPGPALGCNFCWNTVDAHGRILRRKTKYHCPECQTNLCIVPCFQEYHERHGSGSSNQDPTALTSSVMKVLKKRPQCEMFE